jgi:hypothetical protein
LGDLSDAVARPAFGGIAGRNAQGTLTLAVQQIGQNGLPIGVPGGGVAIGLTEGPEAAQHQIDRISMAQ